MKFDSKDLKDMSNAVRSAALSAILSAHSGHVGIVLDAAEIVTCIYANILRPGRDRFVLSAGHGSAMLYSVLKLAGYDIGDLSRFRSMGGLPGHPEYGIDGVDATTGPLGQGVGNAVGMALAEKIKKSDGRVFCLCSDGDLMEGVAQESIAFAGRNQLSNLVLIWDDNGISIDGAAQVDVDMAARMRAAGWRVVCTSGEDVSKICRALNAASDAPTFIQCKNEIGRASSVAGTPKAHGYGLNTDELEKLIKRFASPRGQKLWADFARDTMRVWPPDMSVNIPDVKMPDIPYEISTRELSGIYLNELLKAGIPLIGGSADLGGSTGARVDASRDITPTSFDGNYINYGVREHAMGAIMNGLAAAGMRPYGSTFLVFSDYMRPAIRLAAISGLPVIYLFSHDSVFVGEDGPTHQPVEQLPSLRLMPNLNVWRPCNAQEVAHSWHVAIKDTTRPTAIILSRQKFKMLPVPSGADVSRGAYVIVPARGTVRVTLIATGADVVLAAAVAEKLGRGVRVVSMPSVETFRMQSADYKDDILRGVVVAIEAAAPSPWFEFADAVVGIDRFGMSGPGEQIYRNMGFDADTIADEILYRIKHKKK